MNSEQMNAPRNRRKDDMNKELGKIQSAEVGFAKDNHYYCGLHLVLGGHAWSVGAFIPLSGTNEKTPHNKEKSNESQNIAATLNTAKVNNVSELVGKPVEVTFHGNALFDWRFLTEVL